MADFDTAVAVIMAHEGGYVNDPIDPGGATNYGISYRFLKVNSINPGDFDGDGIFSAGDMKFMPVEVAVGLYRKFFWEKYRLGEVLDQTIATKIFDMAVNLGPRGVVLAQRAVNNREWSPPLAEDGVVGPRTLEAWNTIPRERLMKELKSEQLLHYRTLVRNYPKFARFLKGWERRARYPEETGAGQVA